MTTTLLNIAYYSTMYPHILYLIKTVRFRFASSILLCDNETSFICSIFTMIYFLYTKYNYVCHGMYCQAFLDCQSYK